MNDKRRTGTVNASRFNIHSRFSIQGVRIYIYIGEFRGSRDFLDSLIISMFLRYVIYVNGLVLKSVIYIHAYVFLRNINSKLEIKRRMDPFRGKERKKERNAR